MDRVEGNGGEGNCAMRIFSTCPLLGVSVSVSVSLVQKLVLKPVSR